MTITSGKGRKEDRSRRLTHPRFVGKVLRDDLPKLVAAGLRGTSGHQLPAQRLEGGSGFAKRAMPRHIKTASLATRKQREKDETFTFCEMGGR